MGSRRTAGRYVDRVASFPTAGWRAAPDAFADERAAGGQARRLDRVCTACSHRHRAVARRPTGGVRRHARHGHAIVCSRTGSRRGEAGSWDRRRERGVLFTRRRVDRIPGGQQDQESARRGRAARHRRRRAGRRRPGHELGRRRDHILCKHCGHLQGVCGRGNASQGHDTRRRQGRASSAPATAARRESDSVHDHELRRIGDGERRPAVARQRRAARPHSRRRRRPLCQHGAPCVHEDWHVNGRAVRRPIAAGNGRTSGPDRGRHARPERNQRGRRNRSGTVHGVRLRDPALRHRGHRSDSREFDGVGRQNRRRAAAGCRAGRPVYVSASLARWEENRGAGQTRGEPNHRRVGARRRSRYAHAADLRWG